ncbi:MAG TPA: Ig-like domain-containing protein, partial [Candidatus Cloacimonadota bacterium]|nr:Ig-like domain-containing protein [Candidatus Cloacimonadota bacterium]
QLTYTASEHEGLSIAINNGIVSITPNQNWFGAHTLIFTATDTQQTFVSTEVSLTVNNVNDAPVINLPESYAIEEDSVLTVDLSEFISDMDNTIDQLVLNVENTEHLNTVINGHLLTVTPAENWFGSEYIYITLNDEQNPTMSLRRQLNHLQKQNKRNTRICVMDSVLIIVNPVNDTPVLILPDSVLIQEDTQIQLDVTPFIIDPDNSSFTLTIEESPNLNITVEGMIANVSIQENWFGETYVRMTVTENDRRLSISDSLRVIVLPVNDAPLIVTSTPDSSTIHVEALIETTFSIVAEDVEGDSLSFVWMINDVVAETDSAQFNTIFDQEGTYTVKVIVSDSTDSVEHEWQVIVTPNSIDDHLISATVLKGNYPNPFNPTTHIRFDLKQNGPVKINIYNIKGQLVKQLLNDSYKAGHHTVTWNGKDDRGKSVSSGVYFYHMQSSDYSAVRKMMMIK